MTETARATALVDLPVHDFLDRLASDAPVPGGGSAAALTGALAAALVAMVARLTVGRPRYAAADPAMSFILETAAELQTRLAELVDADAVAYQQVRAAARLPRQTPDEQAARERARQSALIMASQTALSTAMFCAEALELAAGTVSLGNRNATSDALVAVWLADAALRGAARNVRDNLSGISGSQERALARLMRDQLATYVAKGAAIVAQAEAAAAARGE